MTYSSSQRRTIISIIISCPLSFFVYCVRLIILGILIVLYRGRGRLTMRFHVTVSRTGRLPPFPNVVPSARIMVASGPGREIICVSLKHGTGLRLAGDWRPGARWERGGWGALRNEDIVRWGVVEELRSGRRRNGGRRRMIIENPAE